MEFDGGLYQGRAEIDEYGYSRGECQTWAIANDSLTFALLP
jgi:hypothetical protein